MPIRGPNSRPDIGPKKGIAISSRIAIDKAPQAQNRPEERHNYSQRGAQNYSQK
jgi:hypothetical protein